MKQLVTLYSDIPKDKFESLSVSIVEFEDAAAALIEQAERAEITDEETYAKGGDLIKVARAHVAKAEQMRKELKAPVLAVSKMIEDSFKPLKTEFDKVRTTIEKKMAAWKAEEDKRRREEAEKRRREIEEEALRKAESAKSDEDQDKILSEAADAGKDIEDNSGVGLRRGMFGSTGTRKTYSTEVTNMRDFLWSLLEQYDNGNVELGAVIEFRKAGLNTLAKDMLERGVKALPGAKFIESESIRVY